LNGLFKLLFRSKKSKHIKIRTSFFMFMSDYIWTDYDQFFWANLAKPISCGSVRLEAKPIILDAKQEQYNTFLDKLGSGAIHIDYTHEQCRLHSLYSEKGLSIPLENRLAYGLVYDYRKLRMQNSVFKQFFGVSDENRIPDSYPASLTDLPEEITKASSIFLHEYIFPLAWTESGRRITYDDLAISVALSTKQQQPALRFGIRASARQCFEPVGYEIDSKYPHLRYSGEFLFEKIEGRLAFIRRVINS
jgi:hypothetical protein